MSQDIYVTTTESLYPRQNEFNELVIRLYGRTPEGKTRQITVRGFEPYFLIPREESDKVAPAEHDELVGYEPVNETPLSERYDSDPTPLSKVTVELPHAIPQLRDQFDTTYAADTIFTERFRIETGIKTGVRVPVEQKRDDHIVVDVDELEPVEVDAEPRVVTLDIETDDRGSGFPEPGDARILSIAVHDSYTDEYEVFLDLDGESFTDFFDLSPVQKAKLGDGELNLSDIGITEADKLTHHSSEKQMLDAFGSWVQDVNPDLLCGWNSGDGSNDGFDLPHIIERMKSIGASPERLSREGEVEVKGYDSDDKPSITGRALYDLMDGWADTKFTKPRSKKLDDVAQKALDDAKIEHEEQGYFEMYADDPVKFINYNVKDTRLTVEINDEENVLGFKRRLKDIIGVDWRRTHQNNEFIEMAVRRKCDEHDLVLITATDNPHVANSSGDDVNFEGAYVFPSFSGVKKNVCGVDLASLYPMTQYMLNVSPDVRIEVEKGLPEWYELKDEINGQYVEAANGQMYRTDVDGIIRELVDEYHELKAKFKRRRNNAEYGTVEWFAYAEAYNVLKTIYNSFYGYSGWDMSPIYNPADAAAVTLTGQRVIKRTAQFFDEETDAEIVYGDTDSNYVEFPSEMSQEETLEIATSHCEHLTNEIYPELCDEFRIDRENNRWEIEVEMRAERFFQSGSKKRYAYLKMWDEGDDFDSKVNDGDGKFSVTGYDCVKSNFSLLTKETQEEVLEKIVRGSDKGAVVETVHDAATSIDATDPDLSKIGIPQGLGQKIDPEKADEEGYYSWSTTGDHPKSEAPRAAWFANHLLDVRFEKDDNPMRVKVKPTLTVRGEPVDVIAFDTPPDLIGTDIQIDAAEMQRKCLENPLGDILDAFGVEIAPALRGQNQSQSDLRNFM